MSYVQDNNIGLCATSGCILAASPVVNFKDPISNKTTANPYLEIDSPNASRFSSARADRYDRAIT